MESKIRIISCVGRASVVVVVCNRSVSSNRSVSNGRIVSKVTSDVSDNSIVSDVSIVDNVSIVRSLSSVSKKKNIPLALVGYEMIIANSVLRASLVIFHLSV